MRGIKRRAAALLAFFRVNRLFALVVLCEAAFLLLLLYKALFTPLHSLSVHPADLDAGGRASVRLTDSQLVLQEDPEAPNGYSVRTGPYLLCSGGYEVTAFYHSDVDGTGGMNRAAATVQVSATSGIMTAGLPLDDAHEDATGRVYSPFAAKVVDLQVIIWYAGKGTLEFYGLELQESGLYRAMRLLGFALLFAVADLFAYAFLVRGRRRERDWSTALALAGMILFASAPLFADFLVVGHDLNFHLARIAAVADELKNGQFPVRMMTAMCNGYGYANSLYYCDIFLYLPALLYNCMLPMRTCYQVYVIAVNAATCLFAFYAFQRMTGSRKLSLVGAALYTLALYRLVNIYLRSALGEYTAMAFFPLVILGMCRIYTEDKPKMRDWLPLALGMAGVIMSHTLSVEMAVVLLLIFCVPRLGKTLDRTRFTALVKSALLCSLLTAWYIVPFLESMLLQKTRIDNYTKNIQGAGLYPVQLFGLFSPGSGSSVSGMQGEMPLALGPALTLGVVCVLYVLFHRDAWGLEERPRFRVCRELFAVALISMAFTLWCFPWARIQVNVPQLSKLVSAIQFPWRFLSPATALLIPAVLLALMEWSRCDQRMARTASLVLCAAAVAGSGYFFFGLTSSGTETAAVFENRMDMTTIMNGEYLLASTEILDPIYTAQAEAVSGGAEFRYGKERGVGYLQVNWTGPEGAVVEVPIFAYRNYQVEDSTSGDALPVSEGSEGRIAVTLPGGYQGTVEIRYVPPFYWHIAEIVSLASLAVMLLCAFREKRGSRAAAAASAVPSKEQ